MKRTKLVMTEPLNGCSSIENEEQIRGHVALVLRGTCTFIEKALIAQLAGAVAIIITDYYTSDLAINRNSPIWMDHYYVDMVSEEKKSRLKKKSDLVKIPAGFLLGKNGKMIMETMEKLNLQYASIYIPVNLTFTSIEKLRMPPWHVW